MSRVYFTRYLAIAALLLPLGLQAQSLSDVQNLSPEERSAYLDSMSDEERQAKREEWRAERAGMSDEQRAAMREEMRTRRDSMSAEDRQARREEMRRRWDSMSEEDRATARNHFHGHRGDRGDGGKHHRERQDSN